jgi:glutaconate CoA-transferase subunit B
MVMPENNYSANDMMVVSASRYLKDGSVVFIGIGLPSLAANLARKLHAPNISMIYESGTLDTKPERPPLSIGDDELSRTALSVVSVPEMFQYWLQGGKIETGFLGAAQIDKFGNLNTTVIGDYNSPKVRLPGAGGAPEIAGFCDHTIIMLKQSKRSFVEKLDFVTTVGYGNGGNDISQLGFTGKGPIAIITDLGILEPDPVSKEFILTQIHSGISIDKVKESTGWPLRVAGNVQITQEPNTDEINALRVLQAYLN